MRVSERQRFDTATTRVNQARRDNIDTMERLSTQKRVNRISDDPVASARVIREKSRLGGVRQAMKSSDYARSFLERSEAALDGIGESLLRAKDLSILLANDTYDASSRVAAGREIKELLNQVLTQANTRYGGRFVFSGFRTDTPALSGDGAYLGDDGAIFLQVDGDDFRQVNLNARYLFEPTPDERDANHFGIIDTLKLLQRGLNDNDDQSIQKAISELDFQLEKTSSYRATIGAMYNSIGAADSGNQLDEEVALQEISRAEDADIFKTTSNFKRTESILQSTLLASNKMLQPSLLNFLQ